MLLLWLGSAPRPQRRIFRDASPTSAPEEISKPRALTVTDRAPKQWTVNRNRIFKLASYTLVQRAHHMSLSETLRLKIYSNMLILITVLTKTHLLSYRSAGLLIFVLAATHCGSILILPEWSRQQCIAPVLVFDFSSTIY